MNGPEQHPLYQYLTEQQDGFFNSKIKWNFTKFLIDRDGNVVNRFSPQKNPSQIKSDIEELL